MSEKYKTLDRILNKRSDLNRKFREQHQSLHSDRTRTAGEIYQNTKDLERVAQEFVDVAKRDEYAANWIDRWPVK
tara:strand:- start:47257 stop:47481 length:225 start_codon:yes stop_codon:yes gene_type:complete